MSYQIEVLPGAQQVAISGPGTRAFRGHIRIAVAFLMPLLVSADPLKTISELETVAAGENVHGVKAGSKMGGITSPKEAGALFVQVQEDAVVLTEGYYPESLFTYVFVSKEEFLSMLDEARKLLGVEQEQAAPATQKAPAKAKGATKETPKGE